MSNIDELETKIRNGASKFGYSIVPGTCRFIDSEDKTCCLIGALALFTMEFAPEAFSIYNAESLAYSVSGLSQAEMYNLERGFENKNPPTMPSPESGLGRKFRDEYLNAIKGVENVPDASE